MRWRFTQARQGAGGRARVETAEGKHAMLHSLPPGKAFFSPDRPADPNLRTPPCPFLVQVPVPVFMAANKALSGDEYFLKLSTHSPFLFFSISTCNE
jgi:hypothetical protein